MAKRGCAALLVLLLLLLVGCEWDKRLPFRRNELDPALEGFWWRVLPDTTYSFALEAQALVEFKRGEEVHMLHLWRAIGGHAPYLHVGSATPEPVFTKGGKLYRIGYNFEALAHFVWAVPYTLVRDTLTITRYGAEGDYAVRYVRVVDTSSLNWAARRNANRRQ